jgi:hypothetical protein
MRKLVPLLILLIAGFGCAHSRGSFTDGRFADGELEYRVGALSGHWVVASRKPADVAFARPDLGATLYVDSSCKRYRDASLNVLANHLLFGFDDIEVLGQELLEIDDREALRRVVSARLDGVRIQLGVTVIKKNNCIFDLVLVAPQEAFEDAWDDYVPFVEDFRVDSCP